MIGASVTGHRGPDWISDVPYCLTCSSISASMAKLFDAFKDADTSLHPVAACSLHRQGPGDTWQNDTELVVV